MRAERTCVRRIASEFRAAPPELWRQTLKLSSLLSMTLPPPPSTQINDEADFMLRTEDASTQAEQAHVGLMGGEIHRPSVVVQISATLLPLILE